MVEREACGSLNVPPNVVGCMCGLFMGALSRYEVVGIGQRNCKATNKIAIKTTELTTAATTAATIRIDGHASSLLERVKFN